MANVEAAYAEFHETEETATDEGAYLDEHPYRFAAMIGVVVAVAIIVLQGAEYVAAFL
jgi:hypothetical protein